MQHENWTRQALAHWREHRPQMVARMVEAGTLQESLTAAAQSTAKEIRDLVRQGFNQTEAWEMTRENHLFLAPEPEQDEAMEQSAGHAAAADYSKTMASVRMPGEREQ